MAHEHKIAIKMSFYTPVQIAVVGAGGNGSSILLGLPYLHQAMRAWGHPGLQVVLIDGDRVTATNCVRQPFAQNDIGQFKSSVLVGRVNLFWGLHWEASTEFLSKKNAEELLDRQDIVIGCVDTKSARAILHRAFTGQKRFPEYWLDLGNRAATGQFVLGQSSRSTAAHRLPTVAELYPEIIDTSTVEDDLPSCSAEEALQKQEPFTNQTLAMHALAMLTQLFRYGAINHHGGFFNARNGVVQPIPVPAPVEISVAVPGTEGQLRA